MRYDVISADCHIDLCWLPPDLFASNASAAMRDRMPFVSDGPTGPRWTTKRGAALGRRCGMGSAGREYVPGRIYRSDRMAATGLYDDGKRGIRRITDPELRLRDQDRDGVQGEVLYGVLGTTGRMSDPEAAVEVMRIYNEWLAGFCATHPHRSARLSSIPHHPLEAAFDTSITQFQINMANILASLTFAGVLERHPRLRLVLGESGIGWIPYILQRMDAEWEDQFKDLSLTMPPSEYWRRQCKATFQTDPIGIKLLDELGAENVMWGSDFPHPDGVWPDSQEYIQKELRHLPADVRRQVVCAH